MAHAEPIVDAIPDSLAPPPPIVAMKFPAPIHCTSCFWKDEPCIASSSFSDDPLMSSSMSRTLPASVHAQVKIIAPPCTPSTSRKVVTPKTSIPSIPSTSPTTLMSGAPTAPPNTPASQEPTVFGYFTSEPNVVLINRPSKRRHMGSGREGVGGSGLQWLGSVLQGIGRRIWPSYEGRADATDRPKLTEKTNLMISPVSDELIHFYGVDNLIRLYKDWRLSNWKGKDREPEAVPEMDKPMVALHWISERVERLEVGQRVVERAKGAWSSTTRRREDTRDSMAKTSIGLDYTL